MELLETIDRFLVKTFHTLLRREELALTSGDYHDLSVREFHVIEAVCSEKCPTMTTLAGALGVTLSSATVAVKTLERKGYLSRSRSQFDARRVEVSPTGKGTQANEVHRRFHRQMVDAIQQTLTPTQLDALAQVMHVLTEFFCGGSSQHTGSCDQF